ncbi:DUF3325 domain-containing protein [Acetobacter tropicalis]|uniref:DUF3325 domain-containing protein n=1 Tax=Acetobacter tropicalis TaxID=104102 RepID=A0A094ZDZ4_9PROT|nr:DUF3325 family protein [Acetobacter tropicalis]KAA8386488.1 DUF3325 domain-containing protein [Acetobacter tropicalis]KAA8386692.1 DUF3325 domain-containing protein [Acetobacter tropicalis]KGB20836.1 hypothetical protein AtDm6_3439 [Acetobacter tropicalis]MBC9009911.1 DUF3325 family protein [Acetobacter tropicalis]MDO8170378.1 DUF3325 family protein [Acetobacter tropicalis]
MLLPIACLALIAVCLLALATPRQATTLFTPPLRPRHQSLLRTAGFFLLGASFFLCCLAENAARLLLALTGLLSIYAALAALCCTAWTHFRKNPHSHHTATRPKHPR